MYTTKYTCGVETDMDMTTARAKIEEALKMEGFGILTEIDVRETLRRKSTLISDLILFSAPAAHQSPTRRLKPNWSWDHFYPAM